MLTSATKKKGFSLVESIVAISILFIGLMAVGEFFPLGIKIIGDSQNQSTAANLALAKIEEIQTIGYDFITPGTLEERHRLSTDPANYLYSYQRETFVDLVDSDLNVAASDLGLKKISIIVYWQNPINKQEKSISLTSLTTKY